MKTIAGILVVAVLGVGGCKQSAPGGSEVKAGGVPAPRPQWIKAPQTIARTVTVSWGIQMDEMTQNDYIGSVYALLGGTSVATMHSPLAKPNELYVLATERLSSWIAKQLVEKQAAAEGASKRSVFEGLETTAVPDSGNCFKDDAKAWCDYDDDVKLSTLTEKSLTPATLTKEWRKRLMHNIQDVGDFLGLEVDNKLTMEGGAEGHACAYLLDQVFLKSLGEGAVTAEKEKAAWERVVLTLMMSGGFYFEAPLSSGS